MTNLMKFNAADLDQLMDKIVRNSIGMDDYLNNVFHTQTQSNYPPYNVVQLNNTETRLEVALAGFTKDEVKAFTEYGKLTVKGEKEATTEEGQYLHKGLAHRNFERSWTLVNLSCQILSEYISFILDDPYHSFNSTCHWIPIKGVSEHSEFKQFD